MKQESTGSLWIESREVHTPLDQDIDCEVCVVGGGIAGLSTAYALAQDGCDVAVLEAGTIGAGQTMCTSAHLASALDDGFAELESLHGENGARLAAESHCAAIDFIEQTVAREGIECDFERVDGYLMLAPGDAPEIRNREYVAAVSAGLDVVPVERVPLTGFDSGPALRFARQGQFEPMKYLAGLDSALMRLGGRIYAGTRAADFAGGKACRVTTESRRTVTAEHLVIATNSPVSNRVVIHTKQAGYLTYVIALDIPAGRVPHALIWDTEDPYHYVRVARRNHGQTANGSREWLLVGGEDHKTGQPAGERPFERLHEWARERFPDAGAIGWQWTGQVMEPADGLAFIGRNPLDDRNVYVITGDSGHGLTHGTIGAMLLTDLIMGRQNPWEALYDPSRKTLGALGRFAKENLNTAAQYADLISPGDDIDESSLSPGEGAVKRYGLRKVAVCRDENGFLHRHSAICPHLGGVVRWNAIDQTWDCPCHGSRFHADGSVRQGPANKGLAPSLGEPTPEAVIPDPIPERAVSG